MFLSSHGDVWVNINNMVITYSVYNCWSVNKRWSVLEEEAKDIILSGEYVIDLMHSQQAFS